MKRLYWILGAIVLVALGCWMVYRLTTNKRSAWAYFPEDYLLAVESSELQKPAEPGRSYQINLTDLPILEQAQEALVVVREAIPDTALLNTFLRNKSITYSLHAETNSLVNYLLYIPYSPLDQKFISYLNSFNSSNVRSLKHQTGKQSITDVTIAATRQRFSFMLYDNYLIVSKSSLLVENVALKINRVLDVSGTPPPTPPEYADSKTKLWLNWPTLQTLGNRMFRQQSAGGALISLLPTNTAFQCRINDLRKDLHVETAAPVKDAHPYWQTFEGQRADALLSQRFIPNSTASFFQFSLSDPIAWANRFIRYRTKNERELANLKSAWKDRYEVSTDSIYYHVNRELVMCRMESDELNTGGNILLMKLHRPNDFLRWILSETARVNGKENLPLFSEVVSGIPVYQMPLPELPSVAFGGIFYGFPKTFFMVVDGYAVFGSTMQAMRNYVLDYRRGNVWSSSAQAKEVVRMLQPQPFSMVFNASKSWFSLLNNLKNEWKAPFTNLEEPLKRLNFLTWQTEVKSGNVNFKLIWTKGRIATEPGLIGKVFLQKLIPNPLSSGLVREPFVYRNAITGTTDLIMQTQNNDLVPLAVGASPTIKFRLSGPLVAPIQLMDYFGKGRDQLVLFTSNQFYILDPTPKGYKLYASKSFSSLPDYRLSIFDHTANRKKEFSLVDPAGRVYRAEKASLSLTPSALVPDVRNAILPISQLNTYGDEYAVLLQPNGILTLANSKGKVLPQFPVKLAQNFDGPVFVERSDREADFALHLVSVSGEILKINQKGAITERRQLLKPSRETRFRIMLEETGKDWLIVEQTNQNVTLYDKRGEPLFNIFPITSGSQLRYLDFGAETKIISVTDSRGSMLYNLQGQPLLQSFIPSLTPVTIEFAESYQKLYIYATNSKGVQILTSKIR